VVQKLYHKVVFVVHFLTLCGTKIVPQNFMVKVLQSIDFIRLFGLVQKESTSYILLKFFTKKRFSPKNIKIK
jgi:hypothetical protein